MNPSRMRYTWFDDDFFFAWFEHSDEQCCSFATWCGGGQL